MNDLCANCHLRPASLDWVGEGGALAYVHGMSQRWCERCAVEAQLTYARSRASDISRLERRLDELIGGVSPAPPSSSMNAEAGACS